MSAARSAGWRWHHAAVLALAVLLRIGWAFGPGPTHVDEGGWTYSARMLADGGAMSTLFHQAPAWHVVVAGLFQVAPPVLHSVRVLSLLLGLASLALIWHAVRRLVADERAAVWATLLWATAFAATDIAGRALIEPMQVTSLLAVLVAVTLVGRSAGLWVAVAAAAALLVNAKSIAILPAFGLALWLDPAPALADERTAKLRGLGIGIAVALAAYAALHLADPHDFALAWGSRETEAGLTRAWFPFGRMSLNPRGIERALEFTGAQLPFLLAFGLAGAARAFQRRAGMATGAWVILAAPLLFLAPAFEPQHYAVLYPALAIAAGVLLSAQVETEAGRMQWPAVMLFVLCADGIGRSGVALATMRADDRPALAWIREHVPADELLVGPPYLVMQRDGRGASFFEWRPPAFAPDSASVAVSGAAWLAFDRRVWQARVRLAGLSDSTANAQIAACCDVAYEDAAMRVLRVRPPGSTPSAPPEP